jgi:hypothetical protein
MRHKLSAALEQTRITHKRCVALGNDLNKIYDVAHVARNADLPTLWAKITRMRDLLTKGESESMGMIESLSKSVDTFKAERSTLARFRDDMRTVLGEKNATAKYMVDTVDEMRRDMASIRSVLGYPFATTREVLTQIQAMHDGANRVRDAIGLRSDAPIDYVVQRIADTRRDMLWAQGTVSMVSAALSGNQTAERTEIMARLKDTIKGRERAQERAADLYTTLCTDLNMPTTLNLDEIRDRVQELITLRSNMRTFLGKDMTDEQLLDQVTHLISLRSEYQGMSDTLSILRQSLGLGVDCDKTTIVAKVQERDHKTEALIDALLRFVETGAMTEALNREWSVLDSRGQVPKNWGMLLTKIEAMSRSMATERRALIRFLNMAESSTWHEITNEVVRRISYKDGFISGINDLIKDAAKAVGMDPAQTTLPSLIQYVNACKDSLLGVVGHPEGETLSLNAALSLLQSKVSALALALGLSKYASLDAVENKIALMPMHAPMPALRELVLTMGQTETMTADEAMIAATARIKGMREAMRDLLSTWS